MSTNSDKITKILKYIIYSFVRFVQLILLHVLYKVKYFYTKCAKIFVWKLMKD